MGSWFSSPACPRQLIPRVGQLMDELRSTAYNVGTPADDHNIRHLAYQALKHYNSNHPGAEFRIPFQLTVDMKAACIGFRRDLWYHLNFLARHGHDERTFFAELCYDNTTSHRLIVQTCAILENPSRSSCAMCPEESKILHPDDAEFMCGKEGHQRDFFCETSWVGHTKEFFSQSAMLSTPFLIGAPAPRYRLLPDDSP
ncbi:hypothetical protein ACQ4PT_014155 [Festuca glaucescens]